jgi:transcription-repair coupling factor (superfamily II helicase)
VRGLGIFKPQKQLNDLIERLNIIYKALPELELVISFAQRRKGAKG